MRILATVAAWIGLVLLAEGDAPAAASHHLWWGLGTWALLAVLLHRESGLVRMQTAIVIGLATLVEYTFSSGLHTYDYAITTVPAYVPPGHGMVYLAAVAFGRSALCQRFLRWWIAGVVIIGGTWALAGAFLAARPDVLGLFWFCCLLGFLRWGPSRGTYVGAFWVVSGLELLGTHVGTWAWASVDPVLGVVTIGNPPSGSAGGYGWFDLYALLCAPPLLRHLRRLVPAGRSVTGASPARERDTPGTTTPAPARTSAG